MLFSIYMIQIRFLLVVSPFSFINLEICITILDFIASAGKEFHSRLFHIFRGNIIDYWYYGIIKQSLRLPSPIKIFLDRKTKSIAY